MRRIYDRNKQRAGAKRAIVAVGGNKDYTVRQLPELNHMLQTAETGSISEYKKIEKTMSPLALEIICDWILERTTP
ncbi:MAG: hypothetical protein V3V99_07715 [candidate division Zixibacteria bacterium]